MSVGTQELVTICPRCQSREPWGENSWCPGCGYYPKFSGGEIPQPTAIQEAQLEPETDRGESDEETSRTPEWMRVLFAGVAIIILANIGLRAWVYFNGGQRAVFSLVEFLVGTGMAIGASVLAWKQCRTADKRISPVDAITSPFSIWQPTLERMPETQKRVWCAAWGITMMMSSLLVVGGIKWSGIYTNDWGFTQPPPSNRLAEAANALRGLKQDETDKDLLEELDAYKEQADPTAEPPTVNVFIYGVLADENLELGRILVARRHAGILKHCAVVKGSALAESDDKDAYATLERCVIENLIPEPAVSSMLNATWVKPVIHMKLTFEDIVGDGELVGAEFYSFPTLEQTIKADRESDQQRESLSEKDADPQDEPDAADGSQNETDAADKPEDEADTKQ